MRWIGYLVSLFLTALAWICVGAIFSSALPGTAGQVLAWGLGAGLCAVFPLAVDHKLTKAFRRVKADAESTCFQTLGWMNGLYLALLIGLLPRMVRSGLEANGAWFVGGEQAISGPIAWGAGFIPRSLPSTSPEALSGQASSPVPSASVSGLSLGNSAKPNPTGSSAAGQPSSAPTPASTGEKIPATAAERVFAKQADSVVVIEVASPLRSGDPISMVYNQLGVKTMRGLGSGFVGAPDGLIVTAAHVLEGAKSVRVRLRNGTHFDEVERLVLDKTHDLALLGIGATGLVALPLLAPKTEVPVGSEAIAIGSPLGLEFSVTQGIISARRQMYGSRFLQTQAPLVSGVSGGPLFNSVGEVIGISAASKYPGMNLATDVEQLRTALTLPRKPFKYDKYSPGAEVSRIEIKGAEASSVEMIELADGLKLLVAGAEGCVKNPEAGAQVTIQFPAPENAEKELRRTFFLEPTITSNLPASQKTCLETNLQMTSRLLHHYLRSTYAEDASDGTGLRMDITISGLEGPNGSPEAKASVLVRVELRAPGGSAAPSASAVPSAAGIENH